MTVTITILIITLILSAYFSGMEIAYVSSNKVHLEIQKKQGGFLGKTLEKLTRKPSKYLVTMLVGNNVMLVLYGFKASELMLYYLPEEFQNIFWQTSLSTLVIVLTAEFLPKVFFQIYANTILNILCVPTYILYVLLSPLTAFVMGISEVILKIFFKSNIDEQPFSFSKMELVDYLSEQMENAPNQEELDSEVQIFHNALNFSQVKAREIMIPRTEITAIGVDDTIENLKKIFINTKYSKILVYQGSVDEIIGYVHSFELFKKPTQIAKIVRPVMNIPETMYISKVLDILTKRHQSMAVVIDEYGGTSGILTLEDIVEELFGEIEDEHDKDNLKELQISDNEYLFSARLEVDYLNEKYKLSLPESETYETLGGLVVAISESIPEKGQKLHYEQWSFLIEEVTDNKILTIRLLIH